jgi:hypothetical protein
MRKMNLSVRSAFFYITSLCVICTTLFNWNSVILAEKHSIADYSVAVVGKEVITHKDVLDRLELAMKFLGKAISEKNFRDNYDQTLHTLIDESRQRQGPNRYLAMVKKAYKTQYGKMFGPMAVQKELKNHLANIASNLKKTEEEFKISLGPLYYSFYRREEARVTYQMFLRFRHGHSAINRSLASKAIANARKKWLKQRDKVQYRISEIVVYNRDPALSKTTMAVISDALSEGSAFSMIAAEYSQAPSREQNGDYGWHALDHFSQPVQTFLKTSEIGDMSPFIPLPTPRNPQKWVMVLFTDQHAPENKGPKSKQQKDPGNEFFQSVVFGEELERLSKEEMGSLRKNFPCTPHIPKNLTMPKNFGGEVVASEEDSGATQDEETHTDTDVDA